VTELPPLVFAAAGAGDQAATEIVDRQADEVVTMATAAIRRLGMADRDTDVVLGGGIFRSEDPAFLERIRAGVTAVAPAARLRQVTAPPVVGAALLGLDRLGAPPQASRRLRASLTHQRLTGVPDPPRKEVPSGQHRP
jgi:N-acetylglucosamine kinase-like BadF-type ATPase